MLRSWDRRRLPIIRPGKAITLFALLLPALCGVLGLVIDLGVMLALRRQVQNAADAAVRVAALTRAEGESDTAALSAAQEYVWVYHGLPGATVALQSPPTSGRYAGDSRYVEVVITTRSEAWFIPIVGGESRPTVVGRAVAGPELTAPTEAICVLDPEAIPGFKVDRTTLRVTGQVWVNSQGAGSDGKGGWVDLGYPASAAQVVNGGSLRADGLRTVGGVDDSSRYTNSAGGSCLRARQLPRNDPLLTLPTPTVSTGVLPVYPGATGQTYQTPQHVSIALTGGQTVTLSPGIYGSIEIQGGPGTVIFQPGIYVLRGGNASGHALNITTSGTVQGNGVMFYNTGNNFDPVTGGPDANDGNQRGTDSGAIFGDVTINAAFLNLTALSNSSSPFDGMLIYQRRWNPRPLHVYHNSSDDTTTGTLYARWAKLTAYGPGTFTNQFVVGAFEATTPTSGGFVTINPSPTRGKAKQVYLVE